MLLFKKFSRNIAFEMSIEKFIRLLTWSTNLFPRMFQKCNGNIFGDFGDLSNVLLEYFGNLLGIHLCFCWNNVLELSSVGFEMFTGNITGMLKSFTNIVPEMLNKFYRSVLGLLNILLWYFRNVLEPILRGIF